MHELSHLMYELLRRQWSLAETEGTHVLTSKIYSNLKPIHLFFLTKRSKLTAHYPSDIILMLSAHRCDLAISEPTKVIVEQFYIRLLIIMYIF